MGADIKAALAAIKKVMGWQRYLYARHIDGLLRCDRSLDRLRSHLEGRMFAQYPWLGSAEGFAVYYDTDEQGND